MSHRACTVSLYIIFRLDFFIIVITFSSRYCQTYYSYALLVLLLYFQILSFTVLFPSCTLAGLVLTDLYYFSVSRSESWYRKWIVEHILVQLSSSEFSFFFDLSYVDVVDDIVYISVFSYMCFYPCAWLYMHICVLSCSLTA